MTSRSSILTAGAVAELVVAPEGATVGTDAPSAAAIRVPVALGGRSKGCEPRSVAGVAESILSEAGQAVGNGATALAVDVVSLVSLRKTRAGTVATAGMTRGRAGAPSNTAVPDGRVAIERGSFWTVRTIDGPDEAAVGARVGDVDIGNRRRRPQVRREDAGRECNPCGTRQRAVPCFAIGWREDRVHVRGSRENPARPMPSNSGAPVARWNPVSFGVSARTLSRRSSSGGN